MFRNLGLDPNAIGFGVRAPIYNSELIGHWVNAVAVDNANVIADFSNGCGNESRYWCLSAPGVDIPSAGVSSDTALATASGTEQAAAHVAGALAVLKSRLPSMPMSVVLAVLFNTATDLGEDGVDGVYGHGLVNLSAAVNLQGNVSLIVPVDPNATVGPWYP